METKKVMKKIDWFVDNILENTFNSYQHAAEFFREHYNDHNITNITISRLFKKNDKFDADGNRIVPVYKSISFDIREHVYDNLDQVIENKTCTYCKISKPYTEEFFYINKTKRGKCRDCNRMVIGNTPIQNFMENLDTENWKNHPDYTDIYFERDTDNIFNVNSGKYIVNLRSIRNMTGRNAIDIKWEIFNGTTGKNKVVKNKPGKSSIALDDIECDYMYCEKCNGVIENPDKLNRYCSKKCQLDTKSFKERELRHNDLHTYLSIKYSSQKYANKKIDYDLNHLISLGINCFYCKVECTFGNDEYKPDALTFDKKNCKNNYCKDNVVTCCWFCNTSKNITEYNDWNEYINFIKDPSIFELDLSSKSFGKTSRDIDTSIVYGSLRRESPDFYPEHTSAKKTFLGLVKNQNYKDSIFNFFPIVYLERNCLWNASVDAIDSSLPELEKHRPDNLQIIPKCMNYAKQNLTQEEFLKEWTKRGFKTDFSNCKVKLPDDYHKECYFNKMITK